MTLTVDYLVANWPFLLTSLVAGFLLGWLVFGLAGHRRRRNLEGQIAVLQNELHKAQIPPIASTAPPTMPSAEEPPSVGSEPDSGETVRPLGEGPKDETIDSQIEDLRAEIERLRLILLEREAALGEANARIAGPVRLFERIAGVPPHEVGLDYLTPAKAPAVIAALLAGMRPTLVIEAQDLVKVPGIGRALEQRLYVAGIGTFWEIANLVDEDFDRILQLSRAQRANLEYDKVRGGALQLAQESDSVGVLWNGHRIDDLEAIPGIRGTFEQRLYAAGIETYEDLADATVEQLSDICRAPSTMTPDFAGWIAAARELSENRKSN